ncbi:MAG TPA: hypothetical protein VJ810_05720 [Blastocatellia bacterium]|nr:hypothetical protein [Blastocatellia bacterium]
MTMCAYLRWALSHLFVWAVMMLAAGGLGAAALRRYRFHSRLERMVFSLALGLGLCSTIIFCLGLAGLIYRQVIWPITLIAALGTLVALAKRGRAIRWSLRLPAQKPDLRLIALSGLALITLGYALLLGTRALYPPTQWDAISNHLVIARQYLLDHQLGPVRGTPNQIIQALNHMLFTWALALKDDLTAQLIEFTLLILSAAGLITYFYRRDLPSFGLAAASFWIIHPLVGWLGTSAYVDVGLACYVFLGLYALLLFKEERDAKWLYLAMALLAMAAGAKLPGIFFFSLAATYALWRLIRGRIGFLQAVAGWSIGLLAILPWYGFLLYHTGNPLYPMFPQFNQGEWAVPVAEAVVDQNNFFNAVGPPKTIKGFLQLPYYLTFEQSAFFMDNYLGYLPVVGLWPVIFIFAIWRSSLRWWSFWILAYTIFWFSSATYLRYWLPVVPLLGLAFCESAALIAERKLIPKTILMIAAVSIFMVAVFALAPRSFKAIKNRLREPPPVSESERQDYLTRIGFSGYQGVLYINRNAAPGDTVFIGEGNYLIYYFAPKVLGFGQWFNNVGETRTLEWIDSPRIREAIKTKKPTWVYALHGGYGPPTKQPFADHEGPQHQLVYSDRDCYVWRLKL